jgi:saccharopine dehydrogenase-like NADP-dependent oxidoreductase
VAAKPALIAVGIVGVLVLATGGYFANEWRVCRDLEADYLEEMTALGSNLQGVSVMGDLIDSKRVGDRVSLNLEKANRLYSRVGSQCGMSRAAEMQKRGIALVDSIRRRAQ